MWNLYIQNVYIEIEKGGGSSKEDGRTPSIWDTFAHHAAGLYHFLTAITFIYINEILKSSSKNEIF